jgi:HlyD family secretion protein
VAPLAASVRLVEPAAFTKISALGVEEQRVNVILDFVEPLDKVQTIGDAFRVEASIVVEGARARKRAVQVPRRNGVEALVEAGLKPGEQVIVYPSDALKDGSRLSSRGNAR